MAIEEAHLVLNIFMLKVILIARQAIVLGAYVLRRFYGILVPEERDFPNSVHACWNLVQVC